MNQSWYNTQSWYAPLVTEEETPSLPLTKIEGVPESSENKSRNKRSGGLTPGRIVGLIVILMVVIVASSLAFRQIDGDGEDSVSSFTTPSDDEEMPDSPADFFEQYYEDVESSKVEVNIPRSEDRPSGSFSMQPVTDEELTLQELYEKCAPSIVSISAYKGKNVGFFWGSGVVIREDGLILTNTHVLEDCDRAVVTLDDWSEYESELIGADSISDIALLKIDAKGLASAEMGESNVLRVGDRVAAIGNPELSIGDGILLRLVLYVVILVMGILYVLRYAKKVKDNPQASPVYGVEMNIAHEEASTNELVELTPKRIWSLVVFGIVILLCVLGYVPWDSIETANGTLFDGINAFKYALSDSVIGKFLGIPNFTEFAWWYFVEFSAVWLLGAVVIGFINKMPEKEWVKTFTQGAADLVGVVLVLATSRGISIFMGDRTYGMSITFIYWIQNALTSVPLWAFVIAAVVAYLLIGIFLQSTSGVSGITMPIFGAVAMALFANSSYSEHTVSEYPAGA